MKAKEKFLEYVNDKYGLDAPNICADYVNNKNVTPIWGYLLEFFDSEGIIIIIDIWCCMDVDKIYWDAHLNDVCVTDYNETRQQAQTEAVKKAFEILEERL